MPSQPTRKLIFTGQPTDTAAGGKIPAIRVDVLDTNGAIDRSFTGNITIVLDDKPISLDESAPRPENSAPHRLRATAPGCEDAVSDVFYILNKPSRPTRWTMGENNA
jgi:hypothetical protein